MKLYSKVGLLAFLLAGCATKVGEGDGGMDARVVDAEACNTSPDGAVSFPAPFNVPCSSDQECNDWAIRTYELAGTPRLTCDRGHSRCFNGDHPDNSSSGGFPTGYCGSDSIPNSCDRNFTLCAQSDSTGRVECVPACQRTLP